MTRGTAGHGRRRRRVVLRECRSSRHAGGRCAAKSPAGALAPPALRVPNAALPQRPAAAPGCVYRANSRRTVVLCARGRVARVDGQADGRGVGCPCPLIGGGDGGGGGVAVGRASLAACTGLLASRAAAAGGRRQSRNRCRVGCACVCCNAWGSGQLCGRGGPGQKKGWPGSQAGAGCIARWAGCVYVLWWVFKLPTRQASAGRGSAGGRRRPCRPRRAQNRQARWEEQQRRQRGGGAVALTGRRTGRQTARRRRRRPCRRPPRRPPSCRAAGRRRSRHSCLPCTA
jgi:hypothetical protein